MVLAGTPPWHLLARERHALHWTKLKRDAPRGSDAEEEEFMKDEEIQEETLLRWQEEWESAAFGRWTFQCIPSIRPWIDRKFGELTYFTAQALTGHGDFRKFLFSIKKVDSEICCHCDRNLVDTVQHTILECPKFDKERQGLPPGSIPELVSEMLKSEDRWNLISRKFACILEKKRHLNEMPRPPSQAAQQAAPTTMQASATT
ncbi:uncharacterized protein LOC108864689 [Galendromus occidentalis]|uniref:Uncharacterized protein LOC108864689 n=1 Tax=Galendromus occidentalis TaxID=34638 RepID=A0AAJ7L6X2_9ACAR|nr:uncharacterized protein LOC108864689 [Galendromus occidentalis]